MTEEQQHILQAAEAFVRRELGADSSGHDWYHIERVTKMARRLAAAEGADLYICELAALLHDVGDEKLNPRKEAGMRKVEEWLRGAGVEQEQLEHVMEIISTMSYGGGGGPQMRSSEGRIVQDADRLDALGAIGIGRTFAFGGWKGRPMHDPELPPQAEMTPEEYRRRQGTAVNHFYEKLLKLKDLMNTESAREIAEGRHRFMEQFLQQFYLEWEAGDIGDGTAGDSRS